MNVLIIGGEARSRELQAVLQNSTDLFVSTDPITTVPPDLLFDTSFDGAVPLAWPSGFTGVAIVSAVNKALPGLSQASTLIGMNMIPTFISREVKEWSFANDDSRMAGKNVAHALGWSIREVQNQIGMVTPRILFQIINEACFVLEEATASIQDIDNAMKLGTNYPMGPLAWADKIGLGEVVSTLDALSSINPERYRVCQLLRDTQTRGEIFHSRT